MTKHLSTPKSSFLAASLLATTLAYSSFGPVNAISLTRIRHGAKIVAGRTCLAAVRLTALSLVVTGAACRAYAQSANYSYSPGYYNSFTPPAATLNTTAVPLNTMHGYSVYQWPGTSNVSVQQLY